MNKSIFRKTTHRTEVSSKDVEFEGGTLYFTLKELEDDSENDDNALIKKEVSIVTEVTKDYDVYQVFTLVLGPTDTDIEEKTYKYDMVIELDGGDILRPEELRGKFTILKSDIVTKRV